MSGIQFSDDRLLRYVDDELTPFEKDFVEAQIAKNSAVCAEAAMWRDQRNQIARAFHSVDDSDVLRRLERSVDLAFEERESRQSSSTSWLSRLGIDRVLGSWPQPSWSMTIASAVVVGIIGLSSGYYASGSRVDQAVKAIIALQKKDQLLMADALVDSLENHQSGQRIEWSNPQSGSSGWISPLRTFRSGSGQWCREFDQVTHSRDGQDRRIGVACRQNTGHWTLTLERPTDV